MILSLLNPKEKLKFLDLNIYMIGVDGDVTELEKRLLDNMIAEIGNEIVEEYSFENAKDVDNILEYFSTSAIAVRRIVYMNLVKTSLVDDFYNTNEHFFLEKVREKFGISNSMKKKLIEAIYAERDLRENTKRLVING